MKDSLKRLLGLLLVLSTSIWAQAVCPMMLFPQTSRSCGTHQIAAPAKATSTGSEHQSCPRKRQATTALGQCRSAEIFDSSASPCCSVERPPATSSESVQASPDVVVVGRLPATAAFVPDSAHSLEIAATGPPLRGVLNLKEDLRI